MDWLAFGGGCIVGVLATMALVIAAMLAHSCEDMTWSRRYGNGPHGDSD